MTRDRSLDVAVVGLSARFPGAADLGDWWRALLAGRVLTTRYERADLVAAGVPDRVLDQPGYVPVRGHLDRAEHFDNRVFQVGPREAELLDPQHRLMLEAAWSALEDAASPARPAAPRTAVFASATGSGYMRAIVSRGVLSPETLDDVIHGTEHDFMASRISYKLGLTGPALAVQTACSSSLVAVHMAVQSLLNGDCDQALVVATGYDFPQAGYLHVSGGVQSAAGRCLPFDAAADGVVGGSGVACVVLRRLEDALKDGPDPYAVILGTAVNNDGAAKAGYYAPSPEGQEAAILAALQAADVSGDSIGYLEAHGTGTRIGDPIEWSAASAAFGRAGAAPGQVALGAVKANIGHLDAAAGLAALVKAVLVVRNGVIPPVAGFTEPNPMLDLDGSPLFVPTEVLEWDSDGPRRAGVSAFGIGGTNAHVVIEQPPTRPRAAQDPDSRDRLVVLSAADPDALTRSAGRLADWLTAAAPGLDDVAFTLATGRIALPERLAVAGSTSAEVVHRLRTGAGVVRSRRPVTGPAPLVFLFPGQGTQYPGMGVPYLRALPAFEAEFERCLAAFEPRLRDRVRSAVLDPASAEEELEETGLAQPALFAVGYAAYAALVELGLRPAAMAGHSLGEITAACAAGVLGLPEAADFVSVRAAVMQDCPAGAMVALGCAAEQALDLAAAAGVELETASVNGPDSCVLAGSAAAVEVLQAYLGDRVFHRRLRGTRAFHSRYVEPASAALSAALESVTLHPPRVPVLVNVDGRLLPAGAPMPPGALADQARLPVQFGPGLARVAELFPTAVGLEIGPGRALSGMAEAAGMTAVALTRPAPGTGNPVLTALGTLWALGQPVEPEAWARGGAPTRLPAYPFAGPCWVAPEAVGPIGRAPAAGPAAPVTGAETARPRSTDPRSVVEEAWNELLGCGDLATDADFFLLGGDSLLVTRLARRIGSGLGIQVPVQDLLSSRTLGRQADLVAALVDVRDGATV